jgi:hypothetical protein
MNKDITNEHVAKKPVSEDAISEKTVSDGQLAKHIQNLPNEIKPQRDLWQGIELAIQGKPQVRDDQNKRRILSSSAWAASVVAAVLVTWLSFSPNKLNNSEPIGDSAMLVSLMADNFTQQKKAILVSYGQTNTDQLSAEMQKQLQQLSAARATLKKALKEDGENADLLNLLNFTQQQELNLLQRLYTSQWQTI